MSRREGDRLEGDSNQDYWDTNSRSCEALKLYNEKKRAAEFEFSKKLDAIRKAEIKRRKALPPLSRKGVLDLLQKQSDPEFNPDAIYERALGMSREEIIEKAGTRSLPGGSHDLEGYNMRNCDLRGLNLEGVHLSEANLTGANLQEVNLNGASLYDSNLSDANLQGADLYLARMNRANLTGANLRKATLQNADFREANLTNTQLQGADLRWSNLSRVDIRRTATDRTTDFWEARLEGTRISDSPASRELAKTYYRTGKRDQIPTIEPKPSFIGRIFGRKP